MQSQSNVSKIVLWTQFYLVFSSILALNFDYWLCFSGCRLTLLRFREMRKNLQLPMFFFSFLFLFFCLPYLGLWNCQSVFLILKISHGKSTRWGQLFPRYPCKNWYKNWYFHFYKTYDHQVLQARTLTRVDLKAHSQVWENFWQLEAL